MSKAYELLGLMAARNMSVLVDCELTMGIARNYGVHIVRGLMLPGGSSCILTSSRVLRGLFDNGRNSY